MRRWLVPLVAVAAIAAAPGAARAQHFDALVTKTGTRTAIAGFDFGDGTVVFPNRVFERALAFDAPAYVGADPGWSATATGLPFGLEPLPGNTDVSFRILGVRTVGPNLLYWNGSGTPSFTAPPDDEVLVIREAGCITCDEAVADGSLGDVAGFVIGRTSATGLLHQHHEYFLLGDLAVSDAPTPGVYAVALQSRAGTLDWSTPYYLVFGAGATPAQLDAAAVWVQANWLFAACDDGTDNDGDGRTDWDGGLLGEPVDAECGGLASRDFERPQSGCGLGAELAALLPAIEALRRRRRARAA